MPSGSVHPCAVPKCPALLPAGIAYCPNHRTERTRDQGSAHSRGYGVIWRAFRLQFIQMLMDQQILPVCGACLPMGPHTHDSTCKTKGFLNRHHLHLDHEPPLEVWERKEVSRVCDPYRVQLLCSADHAAKTLREQHYHAR